MFTDHYLNDLTGRTLYCNQQAAFVHSCYIYFVYKLDLNLWFL